MLHKINNIFIYVLSHLSPVLSSKYLFYRSKKKRLDLKNPKWFNEKLMYIKLFNYNSNVLVWQCSDKYQLRSYLKKMGIDENNLPKLINVYDNVDDIDFEKLPKKFALKCSHGCGFNVICEDKNNLDIVKTKKTIKKWIKKKFGYTTAENHYTHIRPHILCEEFIENKNGGYPIDYKIYCFNGEPKIVLVCADRKDGYKTMFYDLKWNRLHLRDNDMFGAVSKPRCLSDMLNISKIVSKPFPFVRVDFYEYNGSAILGEMTFTPANCLGSYTKDSELKLGEMLDIKKEG